MSYDEFYCEVIRRARILLRHRGADLSVNTTNIRHHYKSDATDDDIARATREVVDDSLFY